MKSGSTSYYFNVDHAFDYGVDEAIILQNLVFWIKKNKANKKHSYDDRTWTYNSTRAFTELFPFWSQRQIERILKSLIEKEVIVKGNYNKMGYDKTLWYALKDEGEFLDPLLSNISPNGGIDSTKRVNGFHQTVEPIPDNKPNSKPNEMSKEEFINLFNKIRIEHNLISEIKSLSAVETTSFNSISELHSLNDFDRAIRNMMNNTWAKERNILYPKHLLKIENFNRYLNEQPKEELTLGDKLMGKTI